MSKIGLLGGSFDPPHLGHLIVAEQCLTQLKLDFIFFVPAYRAPHKTKENTHRCSVEHRLEMVRLAIEDNPHFKLDLCEIQRQGISYTYDTICFLQKEHPESQFFFLIGADSLKDLPQWYRIEELLQKVIFVTVNRETTSKKKILQEIDVFSLEQQAQLLQYCLTIPTIGISSTHIRASIQQGQSVRYLIPARVEDYIIRHRLYL